MGYARAMSENLRIERGWILVNGTRQDDGTIEFGTGGEMRFSPFEAMSQRQATQINWGHILKSGPHGAGQSVRRRGRSLGEIGRFVWHSLDGFLDRLDARLDASESCLHGLPEWKRLSPTFEACAQTPEKIR
jgi:hypothetical protein